MHFSIDAPKLFKPLSSDPVAEGSMFGVFCSVLSGSGPLFFQWSKNGQKLPDSSSNNYKIETSEQRSILDIKSISRNDAGNYTCTVTNAYGIDSYSVNLLIKGDYF